MIYIFTIATNIYTEYFENFKNSVNNFYPNEDKILIVFSNKLQEYNDYQEGRTKIKIISIPNLLYTSILLNKFNFIEWWCENNYIKDNQLLYFFDIDTYFYDNQFGQEYLQQIINENKEKVIFSSHPFNLVNKNIGTRIFTHGYLNEFGDTGCQPNIFNDYSFVVPNWLINYNIISSFFTGTLYSIKELNNKLKELYKDIMHTDRIICQIQEEDICNYILLKEIKGDYDIEYIYKDTNELNLVNINNNELNNKSYYSNWNYKFDIKDEYAKYLLFNQKYDTEKKKVTK